MNIYFSLIGIFSFIVLMSFSLISTFSDAVSFSPHMIGLVHIVSLLGCLYIARESKISGRDERWFALIALFLLFHTPFYLMVGENEIAEQLSIWAYYGLVLMVLGSLGSSWYESLSDKKKQYLGKRK